MNSFFSYFSTPKEPKVFNVFHDMNDIPWESRPHQLTREIDGEPMMFISYGMNVFYSECGKSLVFWRFPYTQERHAVRKSKTQLYYDTLEEGNEMYAKLLKKHAREEQEKKDNFFNVDDE